MAVDGEWVLPGHFLPAAERYGIAPQIDRLPRYDWPAPAPPVILARKGPCEALAETRGEEGACSERCGWGWRAA